MTGIMEKQVNIAPGQCTSLYLFPKIKSVFKGTHFVSVENVKAKMVEILNSLTEHDLQNCFEHW